MKKTRYSSTEFKTLFQFVFLLFLSVLVTSEGFAQTLAFPGAEGFGKYTSGGRGGEVYTVTNLNDSGEGSFRFGLEMEGARTIIFAVSGTIELETDINIRNDSISIFGQTAPGDGIATSGRSTVINADNVIIQYVRFRPGDISNQNADGLDALWGREQENIMLDHLSLSWSVDETGSFYDNKNFTLQWSILSESMYESLHGKGTHGYGGIWGGQGATFHHNLLAHHNSRNPRFNGSRYSGQPDLEMVDYRNNVIYNWGSNSAYAAEGGSYNIVNNYYKPGAATKSNRDRIIQPWPDNGSNAQPAGTHGVFYIDGNYVDGSEEVTTDNWQGVDMSNSFSNYGITMGDLYTAEPFEVEDIESFETADEAYLRVLEYAGAILPRRDTVDARVIHEVETGTSTFGGAYGDGLGIIDSQEDVGGWPELLSAAPPQDSDGDGIPDSWETENGLDPDNADDGNEITTSGYSNLELYVHTIQQQTEFLPAPGALTLTSPVGQSGISIRPEFSWTSASLADEYELQIRDGSGDFAEIIYEAVVGDTMYAFPQDTQLVGDETYFWRVRGVNEAGGGMWTDYTFFVTEMPTSNEVDEDLPGTFNLSQNYPNPFNPSTTIRYSVPQSAEIEVSVFDMAGREVAQVLNKRQSAGEHSVQFDASNLSSGVYIYRLKAVALDGSAGVLFSKTRKMTLIK